MSRNTQYTSALIMVISVIAFWGYMATPYSGDDWVYLGVFDGRNACADLWSYIKWGGSHWLTTNGRMANLIIPPFLDSPKFILSAVCTFMLGLMYVMSLKIVRLSGRSVILDAAIISLIALVLPWWDSMQVFDCQSNYIWSSALVLSAYYVIVKVKDNWSVLSQLLACLLCLFAGTMHEGASLPMSMGLAAYCFIDRSFLTNKRRWMILSFFIGTAFVTFSPGIILRAASNTTPDDTLWLLLLKSDSVAMIMCAAFLLLSLFGKGRNYVTGVLKSPLFVLAFAAVMSMCISAVSGIVGRSGWFAELYSIIVIVSWAGMYCKPQIACCKFVSYILAAVVTLHYGAVAYWQTIVGKEFDEMVGQYIESPDGVVYFDYTRDTEIPWYTLGRSRGIPDADDMYLLATMADYFREDRRLAVILPSDARGITAEKVGTRYDLSNGDFLLTTLPNDASAVMNSRERLDAVFVDIDDSRWVVDRYQVDEDTIYHLSPLILDPGDRW